MLGIRTGIEESEACTLWGHERSVSLAFEMKIRPLADEQGAFDFGIVSALCALPVGPFDLHDLQMPRAPGDLDVHIVARNMPQDSLADGTFLGNALSGDGGVVGARQLLGAHDGVGVVLLGVRKVLKRYGEAYRNLVGVQLVLVDDTGLGEHRLQFQDTGFYLRLFILGGRILRVLAEIAESSGLLELAGHLQPADGSEIDQLGGQALVAVPRHHHLIFIFLSYHLANASRSKSPARGRTAPSTTRLRFDSSAVVVHS